MDDDSKEYRRNKPQQKFYKPGSGPLRRSSYGLDAKMDTNDLDGGSKSRNQNYYGSQNSIADDINDTYKGTNMRHKKPEQQLYVPKSGDSCSDNDKQSKVPMRCDNSSQYINRRMSENPDKQGVNSGSGSYSRGASKRDRSFADYHHKDGVNNDINYNRQYRQASETRSISPTHLQDQNSIDRNRDSRSMETSAGRNMSSGGKPPSGRRNSSGYTSDSSRPKYMVNLDNLPPRFRKKFLEQSGHHSFDSVDQIRKDKYASNHSVQPINNQDTYYNITNWSQTLPSRGRGRLRDHDSFDREKFLSTYLKNYDNQHSRKSTPSGSYLNLYDTSSTDTKHANDKVNTGPSSTESQEYYDASQNGTSSMANTVSSSQLEQQKQETDNEHDSETTSQISATLLDISNLDWTEEVEKNIKLDDMCDSSTSFSQKLKTSVQDDIKPVEPRQSKRSGRSRHKDRRSSSRGIGNPEKKTERNRKDSTASVQHEPERNRKDSNVSIHYETIHSGLKQRERERRDSHKSNRSSTIGNSRDDLDRWRSLRSFSREQSTEGRIVSQCNSRDVSANRAVSPRDNDGFRIPSAVSKSAAWLSTNQKSNGSWTNGRTSSIERGRQSPAPSHVSAGAGPAASEGGGSGRRLSKRSGRRRGRHSDAQRDQQHAQHPQHPSNTQHSQHTQSAAPVPPATPFTHSHAPSGLNWREEILESKKFTSHDKQSENSRNKPSSDPSGPQPGLIMLPQGSMTHMQKDMGRGGSVETQKTLFDHQNPSKPIIVQTSPTKIDIRMERVQIQRVGSVAAGLHMESFRAGAKESAGRGGSGYEAGEAARGLRHRALLQEVERADAVLQAHVLRGPRALADHWPDLTDTRAFLQNALHRLLMSDLKYCQADNIEHHFWKILYYNFIELLRKSFPQVTPEDKPKITKLINVIIEEGNTYFENLVQMLEKTYKFNVDDYINDNHVLPPKGLGYVGLALISVQKIYVFLGDLARYKEQVNETNNYAKSKFWYTKAQQINPKNGRPYNQLAILAIYARRKLDAVYYYMRSLMSSNPFHSARESLLSLFDENRKKYEAAERKRRAALEVTKNAESGTTGGNSGDNTAGMRREVWVRPSGHRTTTFRPASRDEQLASMTSVELNKNFITSYLHVHGKLITKIGMETFYESASQMLRQFRALLHRQPLPTPAARLLQLTALNMFAVETTAASLKGGKTSGERTAWLECALGVSLLMFGAMLERCCALLPEAPQSQHHTDALLLLPAIKVWSDWMLCHSSIWNPPPSFDNFEMDADNDPWDWLAKLMNILESLDDKTIQFENEIKEGHVCVRLPEDASLGGFTPLMYMEPAVAWLRADQPVQHHAAEHALRISKLLFFGTEYLVGVEPPVLRLEYPAGAAPRYISAVQRVQPHHPPLQQLSENSEDESNASEVAVGPSSHTEGKEAEGTDETTRKLLRRKEQLETRKATLERHRQRMQEILRGGSVGAEVEVRPRLLVPDTNCFIDHLSLLQAIVDAPSQPYTLAVPVVVMSELEGLRRCARVGAAAAAALGWVGGAGGALRLATSRGSLLASRACTAEQAAARATNDDRVLATALSLLAASATASDADTRGDDGREALKARRVREVVLLTDDRNLRVKALAAELPTRDLPSFVQWAGLSPEENLNTQPTPTEDANAGCN
ncbi:telomerase-binding protein EST1A isoform X2 [Trichoplusia ni]|uniref:Telomerase-binding protein EST1A isoform X2 n=1 Tax=Trichoplusia ni TaxID=7111 RepID=A0A7E5WZH6_TRINI|nr:telomerase-binding protein EST1A isoform X2 [Trichoplusia ni]